MLLRITEDIFSLNPGDTVTKRNLFNLIQHSKIKDSKYWSGDENSIKNTPQQGINWIDDLPETKGVIIKTRSGSYEDDGWSDDEHTTYQYSFKARNNEISYTEKANQVLISQPQYQYPIFLFTESGDSWQYEGAFSVTTIENTYVVLAKHTHTYSNEISDVYSEQQQYEGSRKYVTHLLAERNQSIVNEVKNNNDWICDICNMVFNDTYGVRYIEAHHKTPISTYSSKHIITADDFSLLCPNCHKAVHIYMKKDAIEYDDIQQLLRNINP